GTRHRRAGIAADGPDAGQKDAAAARQHGRRPMAGTAAQPGQPALRITNRNPARRRPPPPPVRPRRTCLTWDWPGRSSGKRPGQASRFKPSFRKGFDFAYRWGHAGRVGTAESHTGTFGINGNSSGADGTAWRLPFAAPRDLALPAGAAQPGFGTRAGAGVADLSL